MNMNYRTVLKHIALMAKVIGIFPVLICLSYVFVTEYDINRLGVDLIGLMTMGYLGYGQMAFRQKSEQMAKGQSWLGHTLVVMGYITCLAIMIVVVRLGHIGVKQQLLFGGMSILLYILFMNEYLQDYSCILSMEFIVTMTGAYYIAMRLCKFEGLGMMYILVIAASIFINNQLKMDEILQRTKNNTPMIERIRKDNMKWVCLLMSIIFIGYPLRKFFAKVLRDIWYGSLTCILYVVKVVISLFPDGEPVDVGSGQASQMGFALEGDKNSIVDIIIWLIVITTITFCIYKNHELILKSLHEGFKRIQVFLKRICEFLFGRRKGSIITNEDYEDIIEVCSSSISLKIAKRESLNKKKWQRKVKKYLKVARQENQYREGYKLLLEGVSLRGIEIRKANTPREIMQEVEEKLALQSIADETVTYEYIRYGEGMAEQQEIVKMKYVLQDLLTMNKA